MTVIENMNFSEIVGILNEPNRPSGGKNTIREIILNSFIALRKTPKILEIGSNTGFSSIEFGVNLPSAKIVGIDINPNSISHANKKKERFNLQNVSFVKADGQNLPFKDNSFDLVFSSNTTSFIKNKEQAVSEYYRVLKDYGILAIAPIYYIETPPITLLKEVEQALGTAIDKKTKDDRNSLFETEHSKIIYRQSHRYQNISLKKIEEYTEYVISNANLLGKYSGKEINLLREKLLGYYILFNRNLQYCGFDTILLMKNYPNRELELFFTY